MAYYTAVDVHPGNVYSVYPNLTTIPYVHHDDTIVYRQSGPIEYEHLEYVHQFPLHEFTHLYGLTPVHEHTAYHSKEQNFDKFTNAELRRYVSSHDIKKK